MSQKANDAKEYYEYKIKAGDTLSMSIFRMFRFALTDSRYNKTQQYMLELNPQVKDINKIKAGDVLRLGVLPPVISPAKQVARRELSSPIRLPLQENYVVHRVAPKDADDFWMLSWLANNSNYLTIPVGVANGATVNFASPANIELMTQINDYYSDYKSGKLPMGSTSGCLKYR